MSGFNVGSQSAKRSAAANSPSFIRSLFSGEKGGVGELVTLAIGLAVVSVVAGLSILASGTSAGLVSAITEILSFMGLIGLAIAIGIIRRYGLFK